jgi:hypothetical protein
VNRCPDFQPASQPKVRCVSIKDHAGAHEGWRGEALVSWTSRPQGPQSDIGWMAAAWELTGALGLEVRYDHDQHGDSVLVIDGDDFRKWWDTKGEVILEAWEARHEPPGTLRKADPRQTLQQQSQERLEDAQEAGAMRPPMDYCPVVDCGCDGNAHA